MAHLSDIPHRLREIIGRKPSAVPLRLKLWRRPRSKPYAQTSTDWPLSPYGSRELRLKLYRYLRDYVPAIKAAINTWAQICNTSGRFVWPEHLTEVEQARLELHVEQMLARLSPFGPAAAAPREQMLSNLFVGLFTDGAFATELVANKSLTGIDSLQWIDPGSLEFRPGRNGRIALWQIQGTRSVSLASPSVYYQPLSLGIDRPEGSSLLSAVPFAARIEQALVADLGRAMHNAGYARLHVKLTPPEKQPGESDSAYAARCSSYFDETVRQLRDLEPDDNAVTWNDVEIATVEPRGRSSTQSGWFVNHRALIEEICAATHLAPFMLGYSFGTTQSWGRFKYGMAMRMARHFQELAARFLEWLAAVDLALSGENTFPGFEFDRPDFLQFVEEQQAAKLRTEVVVAQRDAGVIDEVEARRRLSDPSV